MSLIFDSFPNMKQARAFQAEVKKRFGLDGWVFDNADAAQDHEVSPHRQIPPVVHIDNVAPETIATSVKGLGLTDQDVEMMERELADDHTGRRKASFPTSRIAYRAEHLAEKFGGRFIGSGWSACAPTESMN
jgi:hypothetical protein